MTSKRLEELNTLLRTELGSNEYSEPLYRWARAKDLEQEFLDLDDKGNPIIGIVREPLSDIPIGVRVHTHKALATPGLDPDHWVLSTWWREPKWSWDLQNRALLPWPERGQYYPVDNGALAAGEEPTIANTWEIIRSIRKQRHKTKADWMNETEEAIDKEQRSVQNYQSDVIDDAMTAFGNVPGSRANATSLPSKESTENHDLVFEKD